MPGRDGTSTTSSLSVPSKSAPSFIVRLDFGCTTWKSLETSRGGRPVMSGQLPVPPSSMVQVTGSPTAAVTGTTLEVKVKSPTAPEKFGGASGSGLMVRDRGLDSSLRCSTCCMGANRKLLPLEILKFSICVAGLIV